MKKSFLELGSMKSCFGSIWRAVLLLTFIYGYDFLFTLMAIVYGVGFYMGMILV